MEEEVRMMTMMMDGLDDSNDFVPFLTCLIFLFWNGVLALALGMAWTPGLGLGWCYTDGQGDFSSFLLPRHEMLNYGSYTV